MAATKTTLAAAMGRDDQVANVTSATGFAVGNLIQIDSELMSQIGAAVGTVIPVRRGGQNGTAQVAHAILAPVSTMLGADSTGIRPGQHIAPNYSEKIIISYAVNGAITPPEVPTLVYLTKATAAAMTLAGPAGGTPDGTEVTIWSQTAAAHTITYTAGFSGDTTFSDVITFAATINSNVTLMSSRGTWGIKAIYLGTVA